MFLRSFNTTTATVLTTLFYSADGEPFAVGNDDTSLYMPVEDGSDGGQLDIVSGLNAQILNTVKFTYPGLEAILSSDGNTAYVSTWDPYGQIVVIDTQTLAVTGTLSISKGSRPSDIALSPDGTTLYVSVNCDSNSGCAGQQTSCPLGVGICVFDTSTLALKGQVAKLSGLMAVSQDGSSLYVTSAKDSNKVVYFVNTSTFSVSAKQLANYTAGRVVVDPLGHWALIFTVESGAQMTANVLNTSTNTVVSQFLTAAPGNTVPVGNGNFAAFAPNGNSVWVLLTCGAASNCTTPGGSLRALAGLSFLSGQLIGETAIPDDSLNIAFPR